MKLARLSLFALPAALALAGATVACGSGSSSSQSGGTTSVTTSPDALHGAYVPTGSSADKAEFRALVFFSSTGYFSYRNNCTGSSCRAQGTYVYDGARDLALTDGATGQTRHLDFQTISVSGGGSLTSAAQSHPLDLVSTIGSALVDAGNSGQSLIQQILTALIDGVLMALFGGGNDGGAGAGLCDPLAAVIGCALQGESVQTNGDGSCSCASGDDGGSDDAGSGDDDASTSADAGSSSVVVPVRYDSSVLPIVQISLGGGAMIDAILDTGSSGIWVAPGVIPQGQGNPSGATINQTYGGKVSMIANVTSTTVAIGAATSGGTVPVAEIASTSCVSGQTCQPLVGGDPTQFLFMQKYQAIVGIGERHPNASGVFSPLPSLGHNQQHIVSLGDASTLADGQLIIDPTADQIARFTNLVGLSAGANGGYVDTAVPFCFNSFCAGALLDCGEGQGILLASSAQDYANIGVSNGAPTVPPNTAVNVTVGGQPGYSFTVGATPQIGVDNYRIQASGLSNNLGVTAFSHLDVFYDEAIHAIGVAQKQ